MDHSEMKGQLAKELLELESHDLTVREQLLKDNKLTDGYHPEMEVVHRKNAARLREIIDLIGWPTISKVGHEASQAAWLIVQHSIGEPTFMRACYALMIESQHDINPQNLAYLYDRLCYFEGRPQKYGTQYDDSILYPVENKNEVNILRKKLTLNHCLLSVLRKSRHLRTQQTYIRVPVLMNREKKQGGYRSMFYIQATTVNYLVLQSAMALDPLDN